MARCLLAVGSNLGDRREILALATREVASLPKSRLLSRSLWHETEPIGGPGGQGPFLNGSLLLDTELEPAELSDAVHNIERQLGRQRMVRWDARVIDIDILLYEQQQIETEPLILPHPRMSFRRFVLEPACDIAGAMIHPSSGWTLAQLLRHLDNSPRFVAITAPAPDLSHRLATKLCQVLGCPQLERLSSTSTTGPDSPPPKAVELAPGETDLLQESRWRQDAELAARLSTRAESSLPPVISGSWRDDQPAKAGLVRPALVIAWAGSSPAKTQAVRKQYSALIACGPEARIREDDFSAVVSEAVAAIRAVWPTLSVGKEN